MESFNYHQPTEIRFGRGRVGEVGEAAAGLGSRALLVTVPVFDAIAPAVEKVKQSLAEAGLEVAHFDGVKPNPTTDVITAGAEMAVAHGADVVIGLGGGSSMDSAKAVAVEATHEGSCWDYLFFKTAPTEKTLPVVAVTTTAGTGSEVTQVAVVTNRDERCKSALYNSIIFPRVAIVDPELTLTVPPHVTASTGFDVFTHAFEAYIHKGASAYTDVLALEAIRLVAASLVRAVKDGSDIDARASMSWANVLAGLSIANAGVTLPHGMGMAIGGMYPGVAHGEALAITYPPVLRFTWRDAVERFAAVARIFHPPLADVSDDTAARKLCELICAFLTEIGMDLTLERFGVPEAELDKLAEACLVLPDYGNNPRVATLAEVRGILQECYGA